MNAEATMAVTLQCVGEEAEKPAVGTLEKEKNPPVCFLSKKGVLIFFGVGSEGAQVAGCHAFREGFQKEIQLAKIRPIQEFSLRATACFFSEARSERQAEISSSVCSGVVKAPEILLM